MLPDLADWQARLLKTERVSETLGEIYGPSGTILEVLATHAKTDGTIERVARFRVRESSRVILVGCSLIFVERLRAELGGEWDDFLSALEGGMSLGQVLRSRLGDRMRSVDRALGLVNPLCHARASDFLAWFENCAPRIIERRRAIFAEGGLELVDVDEYLAI